MEDDIDDKYGSYAYLAEQRAAWEQQAENERRRYEEAHPGYEQCPNHPDRPVVDSGVCTKRFCEECMAVRRAEAIDFAIDQQRDSWERDDRYDMRYYSDHPRYAREPKGMK